MSMKKMRKKRGNALRSLLLLLGAAGLTLLFFTTIENQLIPPLKEISHMQCKALANEIIDHAALENLQKMDSTALLQQNGESYSANTALVNQFCSLLSTEITEGFRDLPQEVIHIPIGTATNLSFFANRGPKIPFTLLPMGTVKVDYETDFHSVGINQINYKIWLDISMEMKVVNPLYQETLVMERKIMLADLVFGGKVPEHYFQMTPSAEYLLTE